nr:hypothetical protein [Candidatus Acidoferrales bacterium]
MSAPTDTVMVCQIEFRLVAVRGVFPKLFSGRRMAGSLSKAAMQSKCTIRYIKLMVENGNRSGLYTTAEGIGGGSREIAGRMSVATQRKPELQKIQFRRHA